MIIHTYCLLVDTMYEKLEMESPIMEAKFSFDTKNIEAVRECLDTDGNTYKDRCIVWFLSGEAVEILTPYKEIIKHL